jgi:hypothetical protein
MAIINSAGAHIKANERFSPHASLNTPDAPGGAQVDAVNVSRHVTATLPAMSAYRETFHGETGASLIALASFAVGLTLATVWILDRRSRTGTSRR